MDIWMMDSQRRIVVRPAVAALPGDQLSYEVLLDGTHLLGRVPSLRSVYMLGGGDALRSLLQTRLSELKLQQTPAVDDIMAAVSSWLL